MNNDYQMSDEEEPKLMGSLTPGTSDQVPPTAPPIPPQPTGHTYSTPEQVGPTVVKPHQQPLPGMPPHVTPDMLSPYLGAQKASLQKFGPQQQVDLENNLMAQRNSLGYKVADAGKGFADALMQGVARAGNPGWQQQFENQNMAQGQEQMGVLQKAHEGQIQDTEQGMKLDMQDPNSALSKAYRDSFGPIFSKMGYSPQDVAKMSASQIATVADMGVRYADAQTQLKLKKALLGVESEKASADMNNQQMQRKQEALKQVKDMPWYSRILHPGIASEYEKEAGISGGEDNSKHMTALLWAKANPNDPRSKPIMGRASSALGGR